MTNFSFNPGVQVSNSPFDIPVSHPTQSAPMASDFQKYLNTAQHKTPERPEEDWSEPTKKDSGFIKTEASHESRSSREADAPKGTKTNPNTVETKSNSKVADTTKVNESVTAKTEEHVDHPEDHSAENKDSGTTPRDGQNIQSNDGKEEKSIRQLIEDTLKGLPAQNPLAAILAQIMQLLGVKTTDLSTAPGSGTGDLSQIGITSAQQIIDLLKSAITQNPVKQPNIPSLETATGKPQATLKQELDTLISMLSNQDNDALQTIQSLIADQGKANVISNQVGLNIVTGKVEKLAAAQTGKGQPVDSNEMLAKIAQLISDPETVNRIMKDVKITNQSFTNAEASAEPESPAAPEVKSGNIPVPIVQVGDLKPLNQFTEENPNAQADGQNAESSGREPVQASTKEVGVKPLNLSVIQTQLLVKEKPENLISNTMPPLIQNLTQSAPEQTVATGTETVRVGSHELFSQIIEQAKVMVSSGRNEMEINLKPENLGKIHLKVAMENQIVTAKFVAESQQVKEIIETNLSQLRSHLQENGIQVDSLMVSVGTSNQGQSYEQMAHQQSGQSHLRNVSGSGRGNFMEAADDTTNGRRPAHDSLIDLIA